MNAKRKKKLTYLCIIIAVLGTALGLVLYALKQNINLFYTPTELLAAQLNSKQYVRIGGYVKKDSVTFDPTGEKVKFIVTDYHQDITVNYAGLLPNLFREGQSVVITGQLTDQKQFVAEQVLAKHDEKYMPRAIADKINQINEASHAT